MHTDRGKEESGDFEGCRFFVVGYCVEYGCFLSLTLISLLEGGNTGGKWFFGAKKKGLRFSRNPLNSFW